LKNDGEAKRKRKRRLKRSNTGRRCRDVESSSPKRFRQIGKDIQRWPRVVFGLKQREEVEKEGQQGSRQTEGEQRLTTTTPRER